MSLECQQYRSTNLKLQAKENGNHILKLEIKEWQPI